MAKATRQRLHETYVTSKDGNEARVWVRMDGTIAQRYEAWTESAMLGARQVGAGFADAGEAQQRAIDFVLRGGLEGQPYA